MMGQMRVLVLLALMVSVMCGCDSGGDGEGDDNTASSSGSWAPYEGTWSGRGNASGWGDFCPRVTIKPPTGKVSYRDDCQNWGTGWSWNETRVFEVPRDPFGMILPSSMTMRIEFHSPSSGTLTYRHIGGSTIAQISLSR